MQHIENTRSFIRRVNSMTRHETLRESCPHSSALKLFSLPAAVNSIIIYITIADEGVCAYSGESTTVAVGGTQIQTHTRTQPLVSFEMSAICSRFGGAIVQKGSYSLTGGLLLL